MAKEEGESERVKKGKREKGKRLLVLSAFAAIGLTIMINNGHSQIKVAKGVDDVPIVDYESNNRLTPEEQEIRTQRGRKYKTNVPLDKIADQDSVLHSKGPHRPADVAIPVEDSDMIILGTVTDSKAFISNDKTAVYSEFQVTVDKIFKDCYALGVSPQFSIVVEREGGKVRFPSGRIQLRGEMARTLPHKNGQYVLFLKWDEPGKDFSIITGYEIQGRIIQPL